RSGGRPVDHDPEVPAAWRLVKEVIYAPVAAESRVIQQDVTRQAETRRRDQDHCVDQVELAGTGAWHLDLPFAVARVEPDRIPTGHTGEGASPSQGFRPAGQ